MNEVTDFWASVELMGHARVAGRVSTASNMGGLIRVDVPTGDTYRTEFYGPAAIYSIKAVSEDVARKICAADRPGVMPFGLPMITLDEHRAQMDALRRRLLPPQPDDADGDESEYEA